MAARMLGAGHALVVCDPDPTAVSAAREAGATVAQTPREVADGAAVVMVSLPRPAIVQEVALGADGLAGGSAIEVYVDLSTTGVAMAQAVSEGLSAHGVAAVDAPVSGGPAGAEAGRLTLMMSGPDAAVARVKPLVQAFAGNVFLVGSEAGPGGEGHQQPHVGLLDRHHRRGDGAGCARRPGPGDPAGRRTCVQWRQQCRL
jgi:3-hydroxyisobutyrate dehydrogenase-like beta-hydroxyacid dehydrogenase